jgi:hypothetical protein
MRSLLNYNKINKPFKYKYDDDEKLVTIKIKRNTILVGSIEFEFENFESKPILFLFIYKYNGYICIKKIENQLVGVLIFEKSQIARFIYFLYLFQIFFLLLKSNYDQCSNQ